MHVLAIQWSPAEIQSCAFALDTETGPITQEYLSWSGEWQVNGSDQATGYNELLADVIAEGASAGAAQSSPQAALLQDIPLRLALVGAPFAGKTSMALKLAEDHGCKVRTP